MIKMIRRCDIFTTPTCIKCKRLKSYLSGLKDNIEKNEIDASTEEGLEKARALKVSSVPTIVFYDDKDHVLGIAHDEDGVDALLNT